MTDNHKNNPLAPVTAAVSKIASSNVVQGTRNLLFHHVHNTKESKEVFADYVAIIRTKPFSKLSKSEKEIYRKKLEDTCKNLLARLHRVGLKYEVRRGAEDLIFVFILCPLDRLKQEFERSRIHDWLVGVRVRDLDEDKDMSLTDSERLRLVHEIITNPLIEGGAGINPGLKEFELVEDFLPLHDKSYNEAWIKTWSTKWMIDKEDLLRLRNHFGEKIAYYFAFLQFYFVWLAIPSIAGLITYMSGATYSIPFSIFMILWSITFVEFWRRKEHELAVWWGVRHFSRVERRRPEFIAEKFIKNPITGEVIPYFSPWRRWLRRTIAAPVIIIFSLALSLSLLFYIMIEVIMTEYYSGPLRDELIFLPTIVYCLLIPTLNSAYIKIAKRLNDYENYDTESRYEFNLTQKIFVANFLISYTSILFIGWVYIPFNKEISSFFQEFFNFLGFSFTVKSVGPERLVTELKYFILTAQVVNLFLELILPYLLRFGSFSMKKIKNGVTKDGGRNEDESAFLKRVRKEVKLPVYEIYTDYAEMITQYGYVSLFSSIWPLSPLFAFINNWIELRSDAIKLCEHTRRPIPKRADSIGPWLENLAILTWFSSITNPSLIYLYHPHTNAFTSPLSVVVVIALIWFTEHIFNIVHYLIKQMLAAIPSVAHDLIRKEEYELKKRLLEKAGISSDTSNHGYEDDESIKKREDSEWFWHSDHVASIEEALREVMQDKTE
ncbi:calcium-activated chloride channel-domain-containing protein [Gigaspora rosea]|uniref:Calcium-activated chloride channel-domain-containing protein n=1 Tax=Gigaspora rosea TaxID=44941 RepID=A0A397UH30_9GLOM|nr:calcium-activated chloride channel-domain-containing protein [Gigaspora rosea]